MEHLSERISKMNRLKPCPFCGSNSIQLDKHKFYGLPDTYGVRCFCGAECKQFYRTPEEAIEAWNTRAENTADGEWKPVLTAQGTTDKDVLYDDLMQCSNCTAIIVSEWPYCPCCGGENEGGERMSDQPLTETEITEILTRASKTYIPKEEALIVIRESYDNSKATMHGGGKTIMEALARAMLFAYKTMSDVKDTYELAIACSGWMLQVAQELEDEDDDL